MTIGTRHLVDPQLLPLLDSWPKILLTPDTLIQMRDTARLPIPEDPAIVAAVDSDVRMIPGLAGAPDIALHSYRPKSTAAVVPLPCIFHIHGGGYVGGSAEPLAPIHRALVAKLGCALVSVDYRLAPETAFPGAIEDCYAALGWLFDHAAAIGIDATRIGVMGESAGGGLAAALALLARDRGEYTLAFQHLIYPMLDDRTCVAVDPSPSTGEFVWPPHNNAFGWSALLGHEPGAPDVSPYAAPARAIDLAGLPPTFITSGALDLFVEEDLDYARRLMRAGVAVELHVYPGGFHGFDFDPVARVAVQARRDSEDALTRVLGPVR